MCIRDSIKAAAKHGWINGYGDGSFRADDEINRAEVVTIVNRLLGREADADYIADNLRKLNTFPDVKPSHWAYYSIMETANSHDYTWVTVSGDKVEKWTEKLEQRDWAALEHAWSTAHSAPGGEVTK